MLSSIMSNSNTSLSEEASVSSVTRVQDFSSLNLMFSPSISPHHQQQHPKNNKKKRSLPGNPDPEAEVIALSPTSLMATNRFVCEICNKGFQRDQNLQLHRRGHNLPWKLKQRPTTEIRKRVYVCPEPTCVHHNPSRALGDLTGIKKHFCRKHGEKKWKCEKCSKKYAVQSDWKAHTKTCGTKEYRCDCGTLFSRKDSFITHRAFCDALAEETAKLYSPTGTTMPPDHSPYPHPQNPPPIFFPFSNSQTSPIPLSTWDPLQNSDPNHNSQPTSNAIQMKPDFHQEIPNINSFFQYPHQKSNFAPTFLQQHPHSTSEAHVVVGSPLSATALLQKAVNVGVAAMSNATQAQSVGHMTQSRMGELSQVPHMGTRISPGCLKPNSGLFASWQKSDSQTRDFLGLTGDCGTGGGDAVRNVNVRDMFSFTRTVDFPSYDRGRSSVRPPDFGFADPASETWGDC
ncbi:hypothetical protein ACHQM5_027439 [Ranunculus cassubicifolius]